MKIEYKNKKIAKWCTDYAVGRKYLGDNNAKVLQACITALRAAPCVEMLITAKIRRCHELHGNRKNQYAMDLNQPWRLVFTVEKQGEQTVIIISIEDYH